MTLTDLKADLTSEVLTSENTDFEGARAVWNAATTGRAVVAEGVQINLRRMNGVKVNAGQKTALVQGGATAIEVSRATEKYNLVAVTPTLGEVGFTGWTLGGGYGPLSPWLGLGVDNVISAELVLADGTIRAASQQDYHTFS